MICKNVDLSSDHSVCLSQCFIPTSLQPKNYETTPPLHFPSRPLRYPPSYPRPSNPSSPYSSKERDKLANMAPHRRHSSLPRRSSHLRLPRHSLRGILQIRQSLLARTKTRFSPPRRTLIHSNAARLPGQKSTRPGPRSRPSIKEHGPGT